MANFADHSLKAYQLKIARIDFEATRLEISNDQELSSSEKQILIANLDRAFAKKVAA